MKAIRSLKFILKCGIPAALLALLLLFSGCAAPRARQAPAFAITQNQKMVPILPFINTLVPETFSEAVFNDFVDGMNDNHTRTAFTWFGIVKDDMQALEKVLPPAHIYISGEIWSYIENSGCCSTELRVKSRIRIYRLRSHEILWSMDIPMDSFFEHDNSTLAVERGRLARRLTEAMTQETIKALQNTKMITVE
jgi:hypothetical protein